MSNFSTWRQLENFSQKMNVLKDYHSSKQLWKQKVEHAVSTDFFGLISAKEIFMP